MPITSHCGHKIKRKIQLRVTFLLLQIMLYKDGDDNKKNDNNVNEPNDAKFIVANTFKILMFSTQTDFTIFFDM